MVTIFHFDMPLTLQMYGGWMNETIVEHFRDFAKLCYDEYGDRVSILCKTVL